MYSSDGGEDGEAEDEDERRIPTIRRMDLTRPLMIETERAVFTKITHINPSDGAGRLERPI